MRQTTDKIRASYDSYEEFSIWSQALADLFIREINKVKEELDPIKLEMMTGNISRILPIENEVNVDLAVNSMTFEESSRNLSRMVLKEKKL